MFRSLLNLFISLFQMAKLKNRNEKKIKDERIDGFLLYLLLELLEPSIRTIEINNPARKKDVLNTSHKNRLKAIVKKVSPRL